MTYDTSASRPAHVSPMFRRLALLPLAGLLAGLLTGPPYASAAPTTPPPVTAKVQSGPLSVVRGNGTATLTWTAVAGATGYVVGRDGVDSTGYGAWSTTDPASARSRVFHNLVNGRTYTLSVQATGGTRHTIQVTPGTPSPATTAPTPSKPATPQVAVVRGNGTATLTWTAVAGATGYVVGRDGVDSTGYGAWSTTDPASARSRVFHNLVNGRTYTLSVQPTGGTRHTIQVTPGTPSPATTTPTPTPAPTTPAPAPAPKPTPTTPAPPAPPTNPSAPGGVDLVGKSKLPWNSLVMGHGLQPAMFESWRGRPVDGVLTFPPRQTWNDLAWLPTRRADDLLVWSIPTFPEGIGGSNAKVAAGHYDTEIRALASKMKAAGWNSEKVVIRLGWENNGNWYQWGQDRGGPEAFKQAFRRFVIQSRAAGLTDVRWDWNLNKGPQGYNAAVSWTTAYPGDDVVDVIGLDAYDMWNPSFTEADWKANMLVRNPGLQEVANFARAHKKQMALDEWGVCHGANGGGDNPFYIKKMFEFFKANADVLAWESTYDDDGAPAHLNHKLSDGDNPKAAAQYRKPFPEGWGR